MPHAASGEALFEVFDPVNDLSAVCAAFTADPRVLAAVESIYGEPACLFKEKLIFKPAGATGYNLHQDIPRSWERFPRTFLTVLMPIDRCHSGNGATEVFAGYHEGFLETERGNPYKIPDSAMDPRRGVLLDLHPGDIAIFHGLTPHRSAPNRTDAPRRTLYVSYNALSDGGDQRPAHYAEFHRMLWSRRDPAAREALYFR
jgi:ectoine hydroxylase-related dioxygenase (phytanoyl-CoA dioxygenase family)